MNKMRVTAWGIMAITMSATALMAAPPKRPTTPAAVGDVLHIQKFEIAAEQTHTWRVDRPKYKSGTLLVLSVNPDLVYPRQTEEPVLYVGNQVAERVNVGYRSGQIVVVVPGDVDLKTALVWFGTPALPEQIGAEHIAAELKNAEQAGIKPLDAKSVEKAAKEGGDKVTAKDRYELDQTIAALIRTYSPDEKDLADSLTMPRVPVDTAKPKADGGGNEVPQGK